MSGQPVGCYKKVWVNCSDLSFFVLGWARQLICQVGLSLLYIMPDLALFTNEAYDQAL